MAFNSPVVGDTILHTDITQFVNNWSGVAGFGVAFENIQVNESSKYAGDFQNLDATNSYGLRVRDSSGNALLTAALAGCTLSKSTTLSRGTITTDLKVLDASATWNAAVTFTALKLNVTDTSSNAASLLLDLQVGGTSKLNVTKGGILFIGDTANTGMTAGLTINQGASDDEAFALKSSDVAHGITDAQETDTYFKITKVAGADGGALVRGISEATTGILVDGWGVTDDTAKTLSGRGYVELYAGKKSGTAVGSPGADANLLCIRDSSIGSRFIFDAEGTLHSIGASYSDQIGNGKWFINDTANAGLTVGLTINQGANDDEALALKSSDVAHGVTDYAETDTYLLGKKLSATDGGILLRAFSEGTMAMQLDAVSVTEDTTKSTAGRAYLELQASKKSGTGVGAVGTDANLVSIRNLSTTRFIFDAEGTMHSIGASYSDQIGNGKWFINDSANAGVTVGLTINEGANTNEAFAVKSTMSHGMTDVAETDTYFTVGALVGDLGTQGAQITAFSNGDETLRVCAYGSSDNTTKLTSGQAYLELRAAKKSGTTIGAPGADANLVVIQSNTTTEFIFDAEGSAHANVEWVAFDDYDDIALLNALDAEFQRRRDPIKNEFGAFLQEHRNILQREKIVNFYDTDGPRAMVNFTRLSMLMAGTIRQLGQRLQLAEQKLSLLPGGNA